MLAKAIRGSNSIEGYIVAEDEAAYMAEGQTVMVVPTKLVPVIRELFGNNRI